MYWDYVVTTRHCLDEIAGDTVYVRVNSLFSPISENPNPVQTKDLPTRKSEWVTHPKADVAAILYPAPALWEAASYSPIPLAAFVGRDWKFRPTGEPYASEVIEISKRYDGFNIQLGDDVFFAGLFSESAGRKRNLPIARFGNISRMPGDELITIESPVSTAEIQAYLAECRSWGGHSGSPVFWHSVLLPSETIRADVGDGKKLLQVITGRSFIVALLGLVSAHFDIKRQIGTESLTAKMNAGIAVITPAENIRELLMSDEMIDDRKKRASQEKESAATADFASSVEGGPTQKTRAKKAVDRIDIPIPTRGQFERDLGKAMRKRKPS